MKCSDDLRPLLRVTLLIGRGFIPLMFKTVPRGLVHDWSSGVASAGVLCAGISASLIFSHLREFAKRVKLSGTAEELESFEYLRAVLEGYGYITKLIQHDAYISLPRRATVNIAGENPRCITHSFSRSSPKRGLTGAVYDLGKGSDEDFATRDVRGGIVLVEGTRNPSNERPCYPRWRNRSDPHQPARASARNVHLSGVGEPRHRDGALAAKDGRSDGLSVCGERIKARVRDGKPEVKATLITMSIPAGAPRPFSWPIFPLQVRGKVPSCCSQGTTTRGITV